MSEEDKEILHELIGFIRLMVRRKKILDGMRRLRKIKEWRETHPGEEPSPEREHMSFPIHDDPYKLLGIE